MQPDTLVIYHPDGRPFLGFVELDLRRQQAEQELAQANRITVAANQRAEVANQRAEAATQRAEMLAAKLRELGIDDVY